jgi:hypothetical protein
MSQTDSQRDALHTYLHGNGIRAVQALADTYQDQLARFPSGDPADWNIPFELYDEFWHLHELSDKLLQFELISRAARSAIETLRRYFEQMSEEELAPGKPPVQLRDSPAWARVRELARDLLCKLRERQSPQ